MCLYMKSFKNCFRKFFVNLPGEINWREAEIFTYRENGRNAHFET